MTYLTMSLAICISIISCRPIAVTQNSGATNLARELAHTGATELLDHPALFSVDYGHDYVFSCCTVVKRGTGRCLCWDM